MRLSLLGHNDKKLQRTSQNKGVTYEQSNEFKVFSACIRCNYDAPYYLAFHLKS